MDKRGPQDKTRDDVGLDRSAMFSSEALEVADRARSDYRAAIQNLVGPWIFEGFVYQVFPTMAMFTNGLVSLIP